MSLTTPARPVLFVRRITPVVLAVAGVLVLTGVSLLRAPARAYADTQDTVNFQARLQTAAGAIVPDGNYNVEFKLYNGGTAGGPAGQGAANAGTNLWTEDYYNNAGHGVRVVNGYLSVNLGSVTPFTSNINWNQQLWMTMNIGGTSTGAVTLDGEMNPRLKLTAVPYAFSAGKLSQYNNTSGQLHTSTLSLQAPTGGDQNFVIQDQGAAGTYNLLTQNVGDNRYLQLQSSGSGTQQTGYFNISGTGTANTFSASNALQSPSLDLAAPGTLSIGTSQATNITIGSTTTTGTLTLGQSTATNTINIGNAAVTGTQTINIGTGATGTNGKAVVTIGSTNDGGSTAIQAGTGGVSLTSAGAMTLKLSGTSNYNTLSLQDSYGNGVVQLNQGYLTNLLTNGSFESGTGTTPSNWAAVGTPTTFQRYQSGAFAYQGDYSMKLTTTATAGQGLSVNAGGMRTTAAGTYTVSFYAMLSSGTMASNLWQVVAHYTAGGAQSATAACTSGITINSSGFQRVVCTFTVPSAPFASFELVQSDATARTVYIDGVEMDSGTSAYVYSDAALLQLGGTVEGAVTLQSFSNSTAAFQIQNAAGTSNLFVADTLNNQINIGGSLNIKGVTTASGGLQSSSLDTAAAGALTIGKTNASSVAIGNTTGSSSASLSAGTGGISIGSGGVANTIQIGNTTGAAAQTLNLGNNATAGSTSTVIAGSLIGSSTTTLQAGTGGINLVTNDATAGTAVKTTTNSSTALTVQNSNSQSILTADTSSGQVVLGQASAISGKLVVNSSGGGSVTLTLGSTAANYTLNLPTAAPTGGGQCLMTDSSSTENLVFGACASGGSGGGSSSHVKSVTMVPEYAGAIFSPSGSNNIGYMSSGYVHGNGIPGYHHNYYDWTTDQTTAQNYDIVLQYQLPSDFNGFVGGSWKLWTYADDLTNDGIAWSIRSASDASCYASTVSALPTPVASGGAGPSAWQQITLADPGNGCTFAAGDTITIDINTTAVSPVANQARVGEFSYQYNSAY